MRRRKVRWSSEAKRDITDLIDHIEQASGSIDVALRYVDRLEARCLRIGDVPFGGRMRDDLGTGFRSVPFERSAIIFYVVEPEQVFITNIFRRGRDYEAILRGDPQAEADE